jgi:hypothetical protein
MAVRQIVEDDIPTISEWFQSIEWPLPPIAKILPHDQGFVSYKDDKLIACAWLYTTGTAMGYISWTNTNPDVAAEVQRDGLTEVIKSIQAASKLAGIQVLVTHTKSEKFAQSLKKHGFESKCCFYQSTWVAPNDTSKTDQV